MKLTEAKVLAGGLSDWGIDSSPDLTLPEMLRPPFLMLRHLERYVRTGDPLGSFLTAVLENDLSAAVMRADHQNQFGLVGLAATLYEYFPDACWGSRRKVLRFMQAHRILRGDEKPDPEQEEGEAGDLSDEQAQELLAGACDDVEVDSAIVMNQYVLTSTSGETRLVWSHGLDLSGPLTRLARSMHAMLECVPYDRQKPDAECVVVDYRESPAPDAAPW